jgi:hypothetical protein
MFANLSNPMAYIISFQMAVLLVPGLVALARYLRDETAAARMDISGMKDEVRTPDRGLVTPDVIYLGEEPRAMPRAA